MSSEEKKISVSDPSTEVRQISNLPNNEVDKDDSRINKDIEVPVQDVFPSLSNVIPSLGNKKFDIQESQEITRAKLAIFLVNILARTILASFALVISLLIISIFVDEKKTSSFDKTSTLVKDLITLILTAQIGLIGTALGFYFGSKGNSD